MKLKTRFILLSLILGVSTSVFGYFVVQRYHSQIPILTRLFPDHTQSTNVNQYEGLEPEANDPDGVYYEDRVLVLMYHDLSPDPVDIGTLSVAHFEQQLALMRDNNFHWISMAQYRDFILHSSPVPVNAVLLTFDDGYESLYKYAYPLLQQYQAPATSFIIVNSIDNPKHVGVPKVTWEQAKLMQENGIDFHSHTYNSHKFVPTDPSKDELIAMIAGQIYLTDRNRLETKHEYEQRVTYDLKKANDILYQKLGIQNNVLAFPYGKFSKSLLTIAKQLDIDVTLTVKNGLNKPGQTNGFRINAGGMINDPVLQISLMKHAVELLGDIQFNDGTKARYYTLSGLLILIIIGTFWLWSGWRWLAERQSLPSPRVRRN